jgi:hypothetical protein
MTTVGTDILSKPRSPIWGYWEKKERVTSNCFGVPQLNGIGFKPSGGQVPKLQPQRHIAELPYCRKRVYQLRKS